MLNSAVILFANEAFYISFNNKDLDAMDRLWARHTPPVCIHPGWSALMNRNEIMQSWRDIFANDQVNPSISCHGATVYLQGDIASVVCYEELQNGWLVATNNFVMEDKEARIFHHQSGQCLNPPVGPTPEIKLQ